MDKEKKAKKLLLVSQLETPSEVKLLKYIDTVQEDLEKADSEIISSLEIKLEEKIAEVKESFPTFEEVLESIVIPEPIKGDTGPQGIPGESIIGPKGDKGDTTIVEKIIEKTEVIRETPIVTENIVEKAVTDEPIVIARKLNTLKEEINPDVIKGYRELERITKENAFNPTMGPSFADLKNISTRIDNLTTGGASIGGTITGGTTNSIIYVNPTSTFAQDNANFSYTDGTTQILQIGSVSTGGQAITKIKGGVLGGALTTDNFLNITGTLPSTLTAGAIGANLQITGAGSSAQNVTGLGVTLLAGYTGSNRTRGIFVTNISAGTGTSKFISGSANYGTNSFAQGATTGSNVGVLGNAQNSSTFNAGILGNAVTATAGNNIGVAGIARNTGAGYQIGGLFSIRSTEPTISESSVVMLDNDAVAVPLLNAYNNGAKAVYLSETGNLGFGINADKTISVDRNTVSNTAGKSLTISSGSATSGSTDKSSTLTLATGISTGGAIATIPFNTAGIQTTGTGGVLDVQIDNPWVNLTGGYTAGDVLTCADIGGGNTQITIDSVQYITGIPITYHISAQGTGASVSDFSSPTGGTGVNAVFSVKRISGTTDNTTSTQAYVDYLGIHSNNNIYSPNGSVYVGYPATNGGVYTDGGQVVVNGSFLQTDYNQVGQVNTFGSRTVFGTQDLYGPLYGSKGTLYADNGYGLQLDTKTDNFPVLFTTNQNTYASKVQISGSGQADFAGSLNSPYGGFGRIQNYLKYSESPANAVWSKTRVTATDNVVLAPDKTMTGGRLVATSTSTHSWNQTTAVLPAGTYTWFIYVYGNVLGDSMQVSFSYSGGSLGVQLNNTGTDWTLYKYPITTTGAGTINVALQPRSSETWYVWGAGIVDGTSNGVYFRTTSATLDTAENVIHSNNNLSLQGKATRYNNLSTVSNGVASCLATVDLTAQGAAIAATTAYTTVNAGMYRVSFVATITRASTTSSVLGGTNGFQFKYTDADDSVVKTTPATMFLTSAANTTATTISGTAIVYAKAATAIQYVADYTSVGVTTMQFNYHLKVEAL